MNTDNLVFVAIRRLQEATDIFFDLHWNCTTLEIEPPKWSDPWCFVGTLHNHDKQGVYAFLRGAEIVYLGLGASRGKAGYEGHGLGSRVGKYIRHLGGGNYWVNDEKVKDSNCVVTIGFNRGHGYLAPALEAYLLSNLPTLKNIHKPGA